MENPNQIPSTIAKINTLLQRMPEGDRARVLKFVEAITQQRQGKRQQRSKKRERAIDDSWRVGQ
ncbi:MAG: hypothetical protein LH647_16045 [Leptolyngbyaceae cyanobacterium CAN_BIN12]|nr:hypothetical protein [Leptolyngbyaceae cyanobacterium CAN_BIN12]